MRYTLFIRNMILATLVASVSIASATRVQDDIGLTVTYSGTEASMPLHTDPANYKIIFDGVNAGGGYFQNANSTFAQDIEIKGAGLLSSNGFGDCTYTFTGAITGDGSLQRTVTGGGGFDWVFTGNMTAWTGGIAYSGASYTSGLTPLGSGSQADQTRNETIFQFGNSTAAQGAVTNVGGVNTINNVNGTGSFLTAGVLSYKYATDAAYDTITSTNALTARYLRQEGTASMVYAGAYTGQNGTASNNTINIMAGSAAFTGAVTNVGNLLVSAGASVSFAQGVSLANVQVAGKVKVNGLIADTVTMAIGSSLDVAGTATIAGNATLRNVNLSTVGAGLALGGATNSIASISGLGNTVSLTSGVTEVSGVVKGVDFTGSGVASLQNASTVWTSGGSKSGETTGIANVPTMTVDAAATVITVVLSDAFMRNFFSYSTVNEVFTLEELTLAGLKLDVGTTVTVNLITVNDYMVTDANGDLWFMEGITGNGGAIVLSGKDIVMTYIPEPTTATLGVLGLAGLLLRRRRKA